MMAKPMKTLELHYPMIQFLIKTIVWETSFLKCVVILMPVSEKTTNGG